MSIRSNTFSNEEKVNKGLEYTLFSCGIALVLLVLLVTLNWKLAFWEALNFWFGESFLNVIGMFAVTYVAFICVVASQVWHLEYSQNRMFGSVELFLAPFIWTCSVVLLVLSISLFPGFEMKELISLKTLFSCMLFCAFLLFAYCAFKLMNDEELTNYKIPNLRKV